jgi:hypothetical protein
MDADNQRLGVQHVIGGWTGKGGNKQQARIKPSPAVKQKASNPSPVIDREAIMRRSLLVHKRKLLQVQLGL